ncbi:MAG: hypothetical protein ABI639_14455 [Thermoanaerobaculia bacterium]
MTESAPAAVDAAPELPEWKRLQRESEMRTHPRSGFLLTDAQAISGDRYGLQKHRRVDEKGNELILITRHRDMPRVTHSERRRLKRLVAEKSIEQLQADVAALAESK